MNSNNFSTPIKLHCNPIETPAPMIQPIPSLARVISLDDSQNLCEGVFTWHQNAVKQKTGFWRKGVIHHVLDKKTINYQQKLIKNLYKMTYLYWSIPTKDIKGKDTIDLPKNGFIVVMFTQFYWGSTKGCVVKNIANWSMSKLRIFGDKKSMLMMPLKSYLKWCIRI